MQLTVLAKRKRHRQCIHWKAVFCKKKKNNNKKNKKKIKNETNFDLEKR